LAGHVCCGKKADREEKMHENRSESKMNPRVKISTLWIVVMFTMVFADILGFITPGVLQGIMTGNADELKITQEILLVFALLTEIPIAMIFLSRLLGRTANRWANLAACVVTIAYVVGGRSAFLHYYFFAGVEILCMVAIAWTAWRWPREA
jgi:hypothetical protein